MADSVLAVESDGRRLGRSRRGWLGLACQIFGPKLACTTADGLTLAFPWTWPPSAGEAAPAAMTSGPSQSSSSHFNFRPLADEPRVTRTVRGFRERPDKSCRFTLAHAGKKTRLRVNTQMPGIRFGRTLLPIWTPHGHLSHCPCASSGSFSLPACVFLFCPVHRSGLWHSRPFCFFFFFFFF